MAPSTRRVHGSARGNMDTRSVAGSAASRDPAEAARGKGRPPRERRARVTFSPTIAPTRKYRKRQPPLTATMTATELESADMQCRRLEVRVRGHVKHLRYYETFVGAYEAEGWRRASMEKIKPSKELDSARRKILAAKRGIVDSLRAMQALKQQDAPIPYLIQLDAQPSDAEGERIPNPGAESQLNVHAEHIYCSRCNSTETTDDDDILLCDFEGCFRAYHQRCQVPVVRTDEIPEGDEPWYCAVCLAIFNALKCINYAFDLVYEHVDQVFPDLDAEEKAFLNDSCSPGGDHNDGGDTDEEEDGDEDFEPEAVDGVESGDAESESDSHSENDSDVDGSALNGSDADRVDLASDVSEEELQYLDAGDVIDPNRRSTRSQRAKLEAKNTGGRVGMRAAKFAQETGEWTFGVVLEEIAQRSDSSPVWRVVYSDDTMSLLCSTDVDKAIALAELQANKCKVKRIGYDDEGEVDETLVVHGKRKRARVDYRELNDMLFSGIEDSEDEAYHDTGDCEDSGQDSEPEGRTVPFDNDGEDEDYEPAPATRIAVNTEQTSPKRGRRKRQPIDYRALNDGVLSF